jgi:hypothetical protein
MLASWLLNVAGTASAVTSDVSTIATDIHSRPNSSRLTAPPPLRASSASSTLTPA